MPAKITISPLRSKGARMGKAPSVRGKRGQCKGWTKAAARRNADFLGSIVPGELTGYGVSMSLTVRTCPETAKDWADLRAAFVERLRRLGVIRFHWVTEWQLRKRGNEGPVPHLHGIAYFPAGGCQFAGVSVQDRAWSLHVAQAWLDLAGSRYGATPAGQCVKDVPKLAGWLRYLTKHGSRTAFNSQREGGIMPLGWESAGRLWGEGGEWPRRSAVVILHDRIFPAYRRLLRSHAVSEARSQLCKLQRVGATPQQISRACKALSRARRSLRCNDPAMSALRPVAGFLGDREVDAWLHGLDPRAWRYEA